MVVCKKLKNNIPYIGDTCPIPDVRNTDALLNERHSDQLDNLNPRSFKYLNVPALQPIWRDSKEIFC